MSIKIYTMLQERKSNQIARHKTLEEETAQRVHKAKMAMEILLEFMHDGKDITDDEEDINIEEFTTVDFVKFMWHVQGKLGRNNI